MRQPARVSLKVPVFSGLGNGLIGSGFILTPQLYSGHLSDAVGQFNQALFLLSLRIVDGDDACFAHAHSRAGLTPGAAAPEHVASLMQDAADGTGSNGWQTASGQGSLQQAEGPGGTLISFTVWFATKPFH